MPKTKETSADTDSSADSDTSTTNTKSDGEVASACSRSKFWLIYTYEFRISSLL